MAADVWYVRGEGGAITKMAPPFGEGIAARLRSGSLRRVNADGTPYEPPAAPAEIPAEVVEERAKAAIAEATTLAEKRAAEQLAEQATGETLPVPDRNARKAEWVKYAVSTRQITTEAADNLSRGELIARFGG